MATAVTAVAAVAVAAAVAMRVAMPVAAAVAVAIVVGCVAVAEGLAVAPGAVSPTVAVVLAGGVGVASVVCVVAPGIVVAGFVVAIRAVVVVVYVWAYIWGGQVETEVGPVPGLVPGADVGDLHQAGCERVVQEWGGHSLQRGQREGLNIVAGRPLPRVGGDRDRDNPIDRGVDFEEAFHR